MVSAIKRVKISIRINAGIMRKIKLNLFEKNKIQKISNLNIGKYFSYK